MRRKTNRRRTLLALQGLEERSLLTALVALVDTGVDLNPGDTSYINDSPYYDLADAYNAYDGSNNVADNNGHGTALADSTVAGIKTAAGQPGAASANVKILPVRDTTPTGQLDINAIIDGIFYAADKGAAAINLSFAAASDFVSSSSATHPNTSLSQAIRYAQSKGSVVVVAAGNSGNIIGGFQYGNQDIDIESPYPVVPAVLGLDANLANMIVTASFNPATGTLRSDSNYGPQHVAVASPGAETSFAAGYLSGVVGVVSALRPDFTYAQVISRITSTVQPVSALQGLVSTGGVISPANAVQGLLQAPLTISVTGVTSVAGTTATLNAQAGGIAVGTSVSFDWQTIGAPAGAAAPTFSVNDSAAAATTVATFFQAGQYTFQVTASEANGATATALVTTTVVPTLSVISISPPTAALAAGTSTTFTASATDQFHNLLSAQPVFTWSVSGGGGGTVSAGVYSAPATGSGTDVVTAATGGLSASASVVVTSPTPQPTPAAQSLGQDGVDLVGNGFNSGRPDGYQDIDLLLTGLPASQTITYVDVLGYGGGEWQYNAASGPRPHGSDSAALVRAAGATTAHLYVSPYQNETGRSYAVVVYTADGSHSVLYAGGVYANAQLPMPAVQSLGQDGVDLVGNGMNSGQPDGYQDIDLLLTGIPSARTITYVDVLGYGGGEWQYNAANGPRPHGSDSAALVRAPRSTAAHLYVSPYQNETGRSYAVVVYYDNGTSLALYAAPVVAQVKKPMA